MPLRRSRPWITLAALALVLYAVVTLLARWTARPEPPPATTGPGASDTAVSDRVVDEALGQIPAPIDSTEIKTGWRDEVPGVDVSDLDTAGRELFVRAANAQMCTCGCDFTLAACRTYDTTCPVSGPRVEALRDSVRHGWVNGGGLRSRPAHG